MPESYNYEQASSTLNTLWDLANKQKQLRQSYEDHLHNFAKALLENGLNLIPCEYLADNQIVVSRAVFDAAKKGL